MKCSTAQKLINDHVNNLLKTRQVIKLEDHLQECRNCREFLSDMESIVNNSRDLETPELSRDLWSGIKREVLAANGKSHAGSGIIFRKFHVQTRGMAFAMSTLLAVFVLIPLVYYISTHMPGGDVDPKEIALNHFELAEQHYQSAIVVLDEAITDMDVELNPELAAVFKKNLELIDDSIRVCKEAIEQSPQNPEANRLLMICYRKKIELLDEIKELTAQAG